MFQGQILDYVVQNDEDTPLLTACLGWPVTRSELVLRVETVVNRATDQLRVASLSLERQQVSKSVRWVRGIVFPAAGKLLFPIRAIGVQGTRTQTSA
jgi:hypothetical protein